MADGTQKPIEQVKLLDEVVSAEGNVRKVKQLHTRDHKGQMLRLRLFGHGHLDLTPEHPVLTERGYVKAEELKSGDMVAVPRYAPQSAGIVMVAEHVRASARVRATTGVCQGSGDYPDPHLKSVPDVLRLTPDAGRIFGLWLAEGHIDQSVHAVVWSFNASEEKTLAAELVGLLASEWGIEATIRPAPGTNGVQVKFRGKLWCELFASLCGRLSYGKRLHRDLTGGPLPFLRAVYEGWMSGDGCEKQYGIFGATVSRELAMNMYDIANAIGLCPAIRRDEPQSNQYAKTRRPVWIVSHTTKPTKNYRSRSAEKTTWRRVREVESRDWDAPVFCLGVEVDNSFIAEGIGVHNCWSHGPVGCMVTLRAVMNQPYVPLSAFGVAFTVKNGKDEGAWSALALDFLGSRGCPPETLWPRFERKIRSASDPIWLEAAKYRVTAGWMEMAAPVYDRDMSKHQVLSCLIDRIPVSADSNWWGHAYQMCDVVDSFPNKDPKDLSRYGIRGRNSWGDGWGERGFFVLTGSKSVPDNAVAPSVVLAT